MGQISYLGCTITLVAVGCLAGLIYDVFGVIKFWTKDNLLVCIISDLAVCILAGFGFICTIFALADGTFAFFEVVSFVFGIILEQIFVKNIFTSLNKLVYNRVTMQKKGKVNHDKSKTRKSN